MPNKSATIPAKLSVITLVRMIAMEIPIDTKSVGNFILKVSNSLGLNMAELPQYETTPTAKWGWLVY